MVEYSLNYDSVFQALADETRRDLLRRLIEGEKTITELARKYSVSFAAIAKHLKVLESAQLIHKHKQGRVQVVSVNQLAITQTSAYLKRYEQLWNERFDRLEALLKEEQ